MSSQLNNRDKALKMMLWFGIGSLFMTFAGLTSAFIVSKNREDWILNFELPDAFYYSLIIIILSSICLIIARRFLINDKIKNVSILLFAAILLGIIFIVLQFLGFNAFTCKKDEICCGIRNTRDIFCTTQSECILAKNRNWPRPLQILPMHGPRQTINSGDMFYLNGRISSTIGGALSTYRKDR